MSQIKEQRSRKDTKRQKSDVISNTASQLANLDLEQAFQIELCWCIEQLRKSLDSGKLNPRQIQDHTKSLNTLMNNSAPMIKKRQVMRLSFGDYREKMAADNKKLSKVHQKIVVRTCIPSKKSQFIKKSALSSGNDFKFNFDVKENGPVESSEMDQFTDEKVEHLVNATNGSFHFAPTSNNFKFDFALAEASPS